MFRIIGVPIQKVKQENEKLSALRLRYVQPLQGHANTKTGN